MTGGGKCLACGAEVTADAPFGLCSSCLTRSVVFSQWDQPTTAGRELSNEEVREVLAENLAVGGGRFRLVSELGRGGMGVVWLAEDNRLRSDEEATLVALKFLAPNIRFDARALRLMQQEVLNARRLRHKNIISLYDWHSDEPDLPFISMEYVEGPTLTQLRLQQPDRVMHWAQIAPLLGQLCDALEYAHGTEGVVHRDLKPGNLMVDARGTLKLADFGLSRPAVVEGEGVGTAGRSSGTLPYMSPQQLLGRPPQPSDDIYSLGATIYELVTGTPPFFQGNLPEQILNQIPQSIPERLAVLGTENRQPAKLLLRVASCLEKDPRLRPASVRELRKTLPSATTPLSGSSESPAGTPASIDLGGDEAATTTSRSRAWVKDAFWTLVLLAALSAGWWLWRHSDIWRRTPAAGPSGPLTTATNVLRVSRPMPEVATAPAPSVAPAGRETAALCLLAGPFGENMRFRFSLRTAGAETTRQENVAVTNLVRGHWLTLPAGSYDVDMRASFVDRASWGASVLTRRFTLTPGSTVTGVFNFRLTTISIRSQPAGAQVTFTNNGLLYLGTTTENFGLDPGPVVPGWKMFEFDLDGYLPVKTNIMVEYTPEGSFPVMVHLPRRFWPKDGENWAGSTLGGVDFGFRWMGGFWAGEQEVTRGQFTRFIAQSPSTEPKGIICVTRDGWKEFPDLYWRNPGFAQEDDHPVVGVSWHDAMAFCNWLTQADQKAGVLLTNFHYRLPTDAEFTRMAQGVEGRVGGGNYAGIEATNGDWNPYWPPLAGAHWEVHRDDFARTAPVGRFRAGNGLADLAGNVAEWCLDVYSPALNSSAVLAEIPGLAGDSRKAGMRVVRGGSWFDSYLLDIDLNTRCAFLPTERHDRIGFRVVLVKDSTP